MRDLLEKIMKFAGEKVGQKPGDQWRGSDAAPPGKKLVGDSILKDLSKGKSPKSKEQELAEEFQAFLEAEFKDTVDKRPSRKGARHARGHEPQPGYKTVKADEGTAYKATNPHPASKDPIVAKVLKQMRPGLTGLDMNNEAFLYFAYEIGKTRAREMWEDYGPAIKYFYQSGIGVNESSDHGPVEARWMVTVSDDEGQHLKTYFDKFPSLSAAKKAYKNTPYASDFKYKPVKQDKVEEAVVGQDTFNRAGYNPISDESDYLKKLSDLSNLSRKPGLDQQMKDQIKQRILDLNAEARKKGYIQAESRGHNIIATKLKNLERERKFAKGELKIPTPQERQAQLKKLEKKTAVKEYGASNVTPYGQPAVDPKKAAQIAQGAQAFKAATGITAPATNIAKALDDASQGKPADRTSMKVLEPAMQDLVTIMSDPKLGSEYKSLAQKVNQKQQKPQ